MQPMVVATEWIHCHVPVHGGFWKCLSFLRCSHLENGALFSFSFCFWQSLLVRLERRRLDPHRLRARAILEEVAVRPLAVAPAVGTALTAARWLWGYGFAERQEWSWLVRSSPGLPSYTVAGAAVGARCARAPPVGHGGFRKNFLFYVACFVALFALGKQDISLLPSYLSAWYGVWVLPVEYSVLDYAGDLVQLTWFDSGYMFFKRPWKNLHIFYVAVNSCPEAFRPHSFEWRSVYSRRFWLQFLFWQSAAVFAAQCSWCPR